MTSMRGSVCCHLGTSDVILCAIMYYADTLLNAAVLFYPTYFIAGILRYNAGVFITNRLILCYNAGTYIISVTGAFFTAPACCRRHKLP
jgi:hypothetical protein